MIKFTKQLTLVIAMFLATAFSLQLFAEDTPAKGKSRIDILIESEEKSSLYDPKIESSYLVGDYGVYVDYFTETDNLIGLSSSKPGPLNNHRISGYAGPTYRSQTKTDIAPQFNVTINGELFSERAFTKSSASDLKSKFGAVAQFTIIPQNATKSSEGNTTIEMYIPKEITITNPSLKIDDNYLPLCYYDGFQLEWNKDDSNTNGVIVIVEWIGEMIVGRNFPETHVRRTCILDDTGIGIIPTELFEGIPDTAVCHMTVLRGNIETLTLDDSSYKIQAESHEFMTFILIREIEYV